MQWFATYAATASVAFLWKIYEHLQVHKLQYFIVFLIPCLYSLFRSFHHFWSWFPVISLWFPVVSLWFTMLTPLFPHENPAWFRTSNTCLSADVGTSGGAQNGGGELGSFSAGSCSPDAVGFTAGSGDRVLWLRFMGKKMDQRISHEKPSQFNHQNSSLNITWCSTDLA